MKCYICGRETNNFSKQPDGKWASICSICRNIIRDTARKNYEDVEEQDFIDARLCEMSSLEFIKFVERNSKCHSKKNLRSSVKSTA